MSMNQVVLYFDRQEDALHFTVAASSVMSADGRPLSNDAGLKFAKQVSKASRIRTDRVLNVT
jgi:hypothetical protein